MNRSLIKKHNFSVAKKKIEQLSRDLPSDPIFDRVEVDAGPFGLLDHKVTGQEMNNLIGKVQNKLVSVNSSLISITNGFREVYNAFDFLDREYINGIIGAVENAEDASEKAMQAQSDIKNTVENLEKTVKGLVKLKQVVKQLEEKVDEQIAPISSLQTKGTPDSSTQEPVLEEFDDDRLQKCETKIKIAYFIGGCSVVLSLTSLILQLLGVL